MKDLDKELQWPVLEIAYLLRDSVEGPMGASDFYNLAVFTAKKYSASDTTGFYERLKALEIFDKDSRGRDDPLIELTGMGEAFVVNVIEEGSRQGGSTVAHLRALERDRATVFQSHWTGVLGWAVAFQDAKNTFEGRPIDKTTEVVKGTIKEGGKATGRFLDENNNRIMAVAAIFAALAAVATAIFTASE